ncbi:metal-binding protein [filamentous cyanobacterium CCP5]|nr:metal-binding protein [filamentous cyanobacterium CCP5]
MRAIHIPQLLKQPGKTQVVEVGEHLEGLETLTPVRGEVRVTHQGSYLEVQGRGEAIVTLTCDRCLQNYNHRLETNSKELIWLREPLEEADYPLEREVSREDLVETLPPHGYFHPQDWIYQQLCLALPQQQLCQADCGGIAVDGSDAVTEVDRRWAALAQLKASLPEES